MMLVSFWAKAEPSGISAIWANEGGDKVAREELRMTNHRENLTGKVLNRAWDGKTILVSGAKNEVLSFNLVIEAGRLSTKDVSVEFDTLYGPKGSTIHSAQTSGNGVFNWVNRPIELFYVRYLPIKGLSYFGYGKWDERQIPVRFQRPYVGTGNGRGYWRDRPDHDLSYPDIMVPLELVPKFTIAANTNQSIWCDIYIPKTTPAGLYRGELKLKEQGVVTRRVPIQLLVYGFTLPDTANSKSMVVLDTSDIAWRYVVGQYGGYTWWAGPGGQRAYRITDKYFQLFHRHKISLIGENDCPVEDHPCAVSLPRLNGSLFTPANGYDGPGVSTPVGVYSVGTYGTWNWRYSYSEQAMRQHTDNFMNWFGANAPGTEVFLYLIDEPGSGDFDQVETWARWMSQNPGPGNRMLSMATVDSAGAKFHIPHLQAPVWHSSLGDCVSSPCKNTADSEGLAAYYQGQGRRLWLYNDGRPAVGTFDTEDDGVSPRQIPWAQYKKRVSRWFYWYANVNNPSNWFQQAVTWGDVTANDPSLGEYGSNGTSRGNGLLIYPGTDLYNPQDSYGVDGPFASLRLKEWRRGIQDVDYISMAAQCDPAATKNIVNRTIPNVLWEYSAPDPNYYWGGISWSVDPDSWEQSRTQLAQIIANGCAKNPSLNGCS